MKRIRTGIYICRAGKFRAIWIDNELSFLECMP